MNNISGCKLLYELKNIVSIHFGIHRNIGPTTNENIFVGIEHVVLSY